MDLRPVGRCRFGELEVQSISTGSYIKMDSLVRVESIRNGNIYVEEEIVNE